MVIFCWVWVSCSVVMTVMIWTRFAYYRERIERLEECIAKLIGELETLEKQAMSSRMALEQWKSYITQVRNECHAETEGLGRTANLLQKRLIEAEGRIAKMEESK